MESELLREVKGREVAEEYDHRKCQRKCQAAGPGRRLSGPGLRAEVYLKRSWADLRFAPS